MAGGPYGCLIDCKDFYKQGEACFNECQKRSISEFVKIVEDQEADHKIADVDNLDGKPIWVFSGSNDS